MTVVRVLGKEVNVTVESGKIKVVGQPQLKMRAPTTTAHAAAEASRHASARYRARKRGEAVVEHVRPARPHTAFGGLGIAARILFEASLDLLKTGDGTWWFEDFESPITIEHVADHTNQPVETLREYGYDILRQREDLLAAA